MVVGQSVQKRQNKGSGFPGAGLRRAQDVAAFEHGGNYLRLDRCGGRITLGFNGLEDGLGEAEITEFFQV